MKDKLSNSTALLLNRTLKSIADSCIRVFIPILIYKNTGNLFFAFFYISLSYFFNGLLYFVFKNFLKKHASLAIALHAIPIVLIDFLLLLKINVLLVVVISFFEALQAVFYYAIKYIYAYMDKNNNVAKFEAGQYIGKIIFVILSAICLDTIKDSLIFVVIFSSVFYILSSIPIFIHIKSIDGELPKEEKLSFVKIVKDNKYYNIFHIFNGIVYMLLNNIIPLYLYINNLSFTKIAIVLVAQYLINILANYVSILLAKKGHGKLNVILGSIYGFGSLLAMVLIKDAVIVYILSIVASFAFTLIFTFMFHEFVQDQKEKGFYGDSIFYRDSVQTLSRSVCSGLYVFFPSMTFMIVLGMIANFMCGPTALLALKKQKQEPKIDNKK